jgi:hypothetical protein
MKRISIFVAFLSVLLIYACNTQEKKPTTVPSPPPEAKKPKLEIFADSFLAAHPNYAQDAATSKKANEDLKKAFLKNTQVIDDFPLKLRTVTREGSKTVAQFYSPAIDSLKHDYTIEVIAPVADNDIPTLKEGKLYYVKGPFEKFVKMYSIDILTGSKVFNDISVKKKYHNDNISLGYIMLKKATFTPVGKDYKEKT